MSGSHMFNKNNLPPPKKKKKKKKKNQEKNNNGVMAPLLNPSFLGICLETFENIIW